MSTTWRRLVGFTLVSVVIFASLSLYADVGRLGARLGEFSGTALVVALALALANYAVRWLRWELYLRHLGVRVPARASVLVFVAGFSMAATPGKVGELIKAVLLRDAAGADPLRTAPVVVAERVADLISLLVLAILGVAAYGDAVRVVLPAGLLVLGLLAVLSVRPLARRLIAAVGKLGRVGSTLAPKLLSSYDAMADLVRPWPLLWGTGLGVLAWLCECLGFAWIVRGFAGAQISLFVATFIYALTTLVGALSFLPGGLVATEASMTLLLLRAAQGIDEPTAVAATILTRLCTFWFAVALGFAALVLLRRAFTAEMAARLRAEPVTVDSKRIDDSGQEY
jgi:uncharacterized protein (TIRG00374 family)